MRSRIRIVLADDHPVVRDGLAMMLETQPDFEVIGAVGNGAELLTVNQVERPDVILLDLEMPELDGLAALKRIRLETPEAQVVIFTAFDTDDRIVEAIRSGAKGYILKGSARDEIFDAIRTVAQGGSLLQPMITSKLIQQLSRPAPTLEKLTARESEVLAQMGLGKPNKEIAAVLTITERTVKFHISAILGKLGATNRTEAVSIAMQHGLIQPK